MKATAPCVLVTTSRNCARNNLSKSSSVVFNISNQKREIPTIQLLLDIQRIIINVKRNLILEIIMEPFSSTNSTRTLFAYLEKKAMAIKNSVEIVELTAV